MKELTLEEIHKYSLGCLVYFDNICRKHGLRYSLAFGTLIGALRHKGFIPWDDDIDVVMLREDYTKLERLFFDGVEQDDIYGFMNEKNNEQYHYTIGRIIDKRTRIRFTSNESDVDNMGVFIDIYPVDYIPHNYYLRKVIHHFMFFVTTGLSVNASKVCNYTSTSNWKRILKYISFHLLSYIGRNNIYLFYDAMLALLPAKSNYVDDLWNRFYLLKEPIDATWFENLEQYVFEGYCFWGFKEANRFLSNHYGNYMQLPPDEERVPHHSYIAYLI